jgi:diguanylate cyclase (GGDEF)-like protein
VLAGGGWNVATLTINQPVLVFLLCGAAAVMYFIEVTAVATMIALQLHQSPLRVWHQIARSNSLAQFGFGLLIAIVVDTHLWAIPLLLPLAVALYRVSEHQVRLGEQTEALGYQAVHDPLTQLPNRMLFVDRLHQALARAARHHTGIAVLFLDLDRFKAINDSLGHAAGDQVLTTVAVRIRDYLRPEDTVARLGGDEFTILLEDITQVWDATQVAERVSEAVQAPVLIQGHELVITTSIGIALSTTGQDRPDDLLRNADVAMYRAKAQGPARYTVFDATMSAQAIERLQLETELRQAVERQALEVYYQPTVDCTTGRIVGFEALVRWPHPQRGLLKPATFIPVAEETGLIRELGRWVLAEACRQARAWQAQYPEQPLTMSVNLSVKQFQQPGLAQEVAQVLRETGLPARSLVLEITESAAMQEVEVAIDTLQELKVLGVMLAIDDFGTGYSSLAYLKRLPIDALKIDRSFVARLGQAWEDTAIVEAIIGVAKTLQLRVTGEGIETVEQLAQLRVLRCDLGQGYYVGMPLPEAGARALLAAARALTVQEAGVRVA